MHISSLSFDGMHGQASMYEMFFFTCVHPSFLNIEHLLKSKIEQYCVAFLSFYCTITRFICLCERQTVVVVSLAQTVNTFSAQVTALHSADSYICINSLLKTDTITKVKKDPPPTPISASANSIKYIPLFFLSMSFFFPCGR
jgi:hypothetical protein